MQTPIPPPQAPSPESGLMPNRGRGLGPAPASSVDTPPLSPWPPLHSPIHRAWTNASPVRGQPELEHCGPLCVKAK